MNTSSSPAAGDASKLAVLGLLSIGPNHGYGLRAILESWQVHRWADIKYGSIYAALSRFADKELVEVVGVDADRGPNRTTYRLTPTGKRELRDLARRAWTEVPRWSLTTDLALMFLALDWMGAPILDRSELETLLQQRITNIEAIIHDLTDTAEHVVRQSEFTPLQALQRAHFDHGLSLLNAELDWSRTLRNALDRGHFDFTPPKPAAEVSPPRRMTRSKTSRHRPGKN